MSLQFSVRKSSISSRKRGRIRLVATAWLAAIVVPLATAGAVLVPGSASAAGTDWTSFLNGPSHNSYNSAATSITASGVEAGNLQPVWRWVPPPSTVSGATNSIMATPVVDNGVFYVGVEDGSFYAVNEATQQVLWSDFLGVDQPKPQGLCQPKPQGITATATVAADPVTGTLTVYVNGADGILYALNAATGATIWQATVDTPSTTIDDYYDWSSPLVVNGTVYVGIASWCDQPVVHGGLIAYNQETGAQTAYWQTVPSPYVGGDVWSSPAALSNGTIIATTGNGPGSANECGGCTNFGPPPGPLHDQSIVELNGSTLSLIDAWQVPAGQACGDCDMASSPTLFTADISGVSTPMVGACDKDGTYSAFAQGDINAGPVWQYEMGAGGASHECDASAIWDGTQLVEGGGTATTIDGTAYLGSVQALNPSTGQPIWQTGLPGPVIGSCSEDGSGVVACGVYNADTPQDMGFYILSAATGEVLEHISTPGSFLFSQPVFDNNDLLVAGSNGIGVTAYDITAPGAAITSVSPSALPVGQSTTVTLTGSGFTAPAEVFVSGTGSAGPFPATVLSPTQLTFALTPAATTPPQLSNVTVIEPGSPEDQAMTCSGCLAMGAQSMTVSPSTLSPGSTGNTLTFSYTAGPQGVSGAELEVDVPSGLPDAPSTSATAAGYVTSTCGTVSVVGRSVNVTGVTLSAGQTCAITYGSKAGGGPGAVAPSTTGSYTFAASEAASASGTLTPLATSPVVTVTNATNGSGTMTVSPTTLSPGSKGITLTFTYTAGSQGIGSGVVEVAIPSGVPDAPSIKSTSAGYVTSTCGTVGLVGRTVKVTAVTLSAGQSCAIVYGATAGGGPGAVAPSTTGSYTFAASEAATASGTVTALASSPVVTVSGTTNGLGTMTVSPTTLSPASRGNTLTFTYTAASGGVSSGVVEVAIPSGVPDAPSIKSTSAGYVTSTCGTVGLVGRTVKVTAVTLSAGQSCAIVYGATAGGGPGAVAPSTTGSYTFAASEAATASGTVTALASSPVVTVSGTTNGLGTMTVSPTTLSPASRGNTLTFTYTAASGGVSSGVVEVAIPSGVPDAPSIKSTSAGYVTSTCGTVGLVGRTVKVTAVTLSAGQSCAIVYGATAGGGPGAVAPSTTGSYTFAASEAATASGTVTALASSPVVTVSGTTNGLGTMTVSPTTLSPASRGNTLTFTYTAASGGVSSGVVEVAIPSGVPDAPSIKSTSAGYVTSTCGTVGLVGRTVKVTAVTLSAGQSCAIVYGATAGGGPGAVAPSTTGSYTFAASEAATASGTVTALASSPVVTT